MGVVSLWTGDDNVGATVGCSSASQYYGAFGREDCFEAPGCEVQWRSSAGNRTRVRGLLAPRGFEVLACAILPDHVHLVLARHRLEVEKLVIQLKSAATRHLVAEGIHPFQDVPTRNGAPPKCFARGEWKVFLNSEDEISRAIRYVYANPEKEELPKQNWWFVRTPV